MNPSELLRAFLLPFRLASLLLVGFFSLAITLGIAGGLYGLVLIIVFGSWFLKYAFTMLDHAAQGRPDAPVLTAEIANPLGEMRPLVFAILIGATLWLMNALATMGYAAIARSIGGLFFAALPAMIAVHAITGEWSQALNPVTIARTTRRLGTGYVLFAIVAIACAAFAATLLSHAASVVLWIRVTLSMMLWLILFSMLGGIIYARRNELGYEPEHSPERRQRRDGAERDRERDLFIDSLYAADRSRFNSIAWSNVERHIARSADATAECAWIYERIAAWPHPWLANRVAAELLVRLLAAKQTGEALRIVRERLKADPGFRPGSSADLMTLVSLARDGGERPVARLLLQDFDRHYPADSRSVRARQLREELAR